MAQTNINIRMDAELKREFEAFCQEVGMSMTTAFTIFAKKAVREQKIPFEVSAEKDPFAGMKGIRMTQEEMDRVLTEAIEEQEEDGEEYEAEAVFAALDKKYFGKK